MDGIQHPLWLAFFLIAIGAAVILVARSNRRERKDERKIAPAAGQARSDTPAPPLTPASQLPPLTDAEVADFAAWYRTQRRDAVRLDVDADAPIGIGGCRIGGPAWLAAGEQWPLDRRGLPMDFLAQVDFADLPRLASEPDLPQQGLLQIFVARDDLFGCDFDAPLGGDMRLFWREHLAGDGALVPQPELTDRDLTPLGQACRRSGRALVPSVTHQLPSPSSTWSMRDKADILERDRGELDALFDDEADRLFDVHHVGGYPDYTQWEFRGADTCPDHDIVLLQLWSSPMEDICWGDVGQANFLISRADLAARDFSRVSYQWDCT